MMPWPGGQPLPIEDRFCRNCSEVFTPYRRDQVYCSAKCRTEWWVNHWKNERHKCPQCGTMHTPDYDALEEISVILNNYYGRKDSSILLAIERIVDRALQS